MSHKNRNKNRDLTDFSDLIIKPKGIKEDNMNVDSIKTAEGDYEILVYEKNHTKED